MYKTRFQTWGVKKYRVASITDRIIQQVERNHAQTTEPGFEEKRTLARRVKRSPGLQPAHLVIPQGFSASGNQDSPLSGSSSLDTAMSSVNHTPRTQKTSRSSSSEKASVLTPGSFGGSEEQFLSADSNATLKGRRSSLGNRSELEACPPRPQRSPVPLRSIPQYSTQDVSSSDQILANQLVDQAMGLFSPSFFRIPTPDTTLQTLMRAPLPGSIFPLDEFRQKLYKMRSAYRNTDLVSSQPEIWVNLCFLINVLCGQQDISAAKHAMLEAALVYQRLVGEQNDQILSILNFVLANLFLHGQAALAAEIISQAQLAASMHFDEENPIQVSIRFMVFMALKRTKTCSITIPKLRQVVEDMKILCGDESHRFCVTSTYHLAWRLAMEPGMRSEALEILCQTQIRSEAAFGPVHMQTVALLTTQARVLGHLGRHSEAEGTMFEALQRIEKWDIEEDHPYYLEARQRYKIFWERRNRVRCI
jgi:hypothetical protein